MPDLVLAGPLHLQTSWQPWALGAMIILVTEVGKLKLWEAEYPAEFTQLLCWAHPKAWAISKLWEVISQVTHVYPMEKAEGQPAVIRGPALQWVHQPSDSGKRAPPHTLYWGLWAFWACLSSPSGGFPWAEPHGPQPSFSPPGICNSPCTSSHL